MKPHFSPKRTAGMNLFEVGIVVAVIVILAAVFLPVFFRPRRNYSSSACVNNLKQDLLALKIWAGDNNDTFPMGISVTNGGAMELVLTGDVAYTFQVMSNELGTPRLLRCPEDAGRIWANNFARLSNTNISYFANAEMTNDLNPQAILIGDSDLTLAGKLLKPGLAALWTNDPVAWSNTRHPRSGNIGLADGSVQSNLNGSLRGYVERSGRATNCLAIP